MNVWCRQDFGRSERALDWEQKKNPFIIYLCLFLWNRAGTGPNCEYATSRNKQPDFIKWLFKSITQLSGPKIVDTIYPVWYSLYLSTSIKKVKNVWFLFHCFGGFRQNSTYVSIYYSLAAWYGAASLLQFTLVLARTVDRKRKQIDFIRRDVWPDPLAIRANPIFLDLKGDWSQLELEVVYWSGRRPLEEQVDRWTDLPKSPKRMKPFASPVSLPPLTVSRWLARWPQWNGFICFNQNHRMKTRRNP